jgi:competence protein ComEA
MKKKIIAISIFLIIVSSYAWIQLKPEPNPPRILEFAELIRPSDQEDVIYVDIRGAVMQPGVYKVLATDRVFQLIHRAGGFHPKALKTSVNQAGFLVDGDVIEVLFEGQEPSPLESSKVSLNRADQATLETLPGIGPSTALAIIKYRETTPFSKPEDLMNVPGIGEKTFENLKDQIVP